MSRFKKIIYGFFFILFFSNCGHKIGTLKEAYSWLNNPQNRLISSNENGLFLIDVKLLPSQLVALQELENENLSLSKFSSVHEKYKKSLTFVMIIRSKKDINFDLMQININSTEELKARVFDLNFDIKNQIKLKSKKGELEWSPAIVSTENLYNISQSKTINIVFENTLKDTDEIIFEWDDTIFNTGINTFKFNLKELKNFPEIS